MTVGTRPTLARAFRRAALPLGAYYAVTLALPIANGAAHSGAVFVEHAVVVLVLPPVLIALAHAVHRAAVVLGRVRRAEPPVVAQAGSRRYVGFPARTSPMR
jgi:hypothetical protein